MPLVIGFDASSSLGRRNGCGRTALSLIQALLSLEEADIELRVLLASRWLRPGVEHASLQGKGARLFRARHARHTLARAWARRSGPRLSNLIGADVSVAFSAHGVPPPDPGLSSVAFVPRWDLTGIDTRHDPPWLTEADIPAWKQRLGECELLLAPTRAICEKLRAEFPQRHQHIQQLKLGVDPGLFFIESERLVETTRHHWGVPTSSYLLAVANHRDATANALLIETYAKLLRREKATPHLVVLGWDARAPATLRARGELHRLVHVLPHLPDVQLAAVYSGAVITFLTGSSDSWPHAMLEAQSCGSPVMATATNAHREVAGQSCVLLESREPRDWAQVAATITFDQATHDDWKAKGLENAAAHQWQETGRNLLRCLRGV
jgi:glycosyltransferase involved in cell wall biosynthesis